MTTTTDYRTAIRIHAPADIVFDAITTTEGLTAWWNPVSGSGLTGGELRFPMNAPEPLVVRVDEATRPTSVSWTVAECAFMTDWVGTHPTFTITPYGDGSCELQFEHKGLNEQLECKDMCSRSWDHFICASLRDYAETGTGSPNGSPRDRARRAAEASRGGA